MNIPKSNAKVSQIIEFYMHSESFRRLKNTTQRDYAIHLVAVMNTPVEGKDLGEYRCNKLKVRHLTQAYEHWLTVGVRTANYRKAVLSTAWKNAMRFDVLVTNPISSVKTLSSEPRRVVWERDQIVTFLNVAYSDFNFRSIGLIVHMAYDWGQRVGDMRTLTWDSLDLEGCQLDLTQSKRNAEVHLPISNDLCQMLQQQKEDFGFQKYVAPKPTPVAGAYVPYPKEQIYIYINRVLDEAKLPRKLTAMDLRRTAVKEMMEGGADLLTAIQVTGHKNIASLKNYQVNTLSGATKALAARGNKTNE